MLRAFRAFLIMITIGLALPVMAQEGFSVGMYYNDQASPQLGGSVAYDKQVAQRTHSYSGVDITPIWDNGIRQIKVSPFTGVAVQVREIGKAKLFIAGAGGLDTTGSVVTGLGKVEGFVYFPINQRFALVAGGVGNYSPIKGVEGIARVGVRIGVK